MDTKITLGEALKSGWDKAFSRFGLILGTLIVAQLVVGVPSVASNIFQSIGSSANNSALAAIFILVSLAFLVLQYWLQILTGIGLIRIQLNTIDSKTAEFGQLFNAEGVFWTYLGGAILYGLIVLGGFLLLIIPGIYWAIKYQFVLQLIVDKKLGPVDALKASGKITYTHKWWLLGFAIILGLINIATIFTLFLGLIITIPVTVMAHMYVYRKLSGGLNKSDIKPTSSNKPAVATLKS
jgi:uncharacterized membrane protein